MNKSVTVKIKTSYGVERIYPVCDYAKTFAKIAGTETLTEEAIKLIRQLGFRVELNHEKSVLEASLESEA